MPNKEAVGSSSHAHITTRLERNGQTDILAQHTWHVDRTELHVCGLNVKQMLHWIGKVYSV